MSAWLRAQQAPPPMNDQQVLALYERVLQLMDKATTTAIMTEHLKRTAEAGIWNHCMGFFGFPGETKEEAWQSVQFLEQNKTHVHSLGFGTFDLGRHNPVAKHPEKWGVTAYKNPEWDLALDYYFTVKNGTSAGGVASAGAGASGRW